MSSILATISGWFWSEAIWLPPGYTWKDFGPRPHLFLYSIPLCLAIFCTRIVLERGLFRSVAVGLGVGPAKTRVAATNDVLETVHRWYWQLNNTFITRHSLLILETMQNCQRKK